MRALVTGGCGFIGGHIVDKLLAKGYAVTVLDCLEEPTHHNGKPNYLPEKVRFIRGNVLEHEKLIDALDAVDVVFHQAATGGFTNNISKYYTWNTLATAALWEVIVQKKIKLRKVIVASSVAVYGEGKYQCSSCGIVSPLPRSVQQLENNDWEVHCLTCDKILTPLPTDELKPVHPLMHYSQSKYDQERISLIMGEKTNIPVVALRYFLTYGPRQSPTNPYTGVCSLFATALLNNKKPIIYEDGSQTRDFVSVEDVADANLFVMEQDAANNKVFNVGTGIPTPIHDVATFIAHELGKDGLFEKKQLEKKQAYRVGDVRHITADIQSLTTLGFTPRISLREGLQKYMQWFKKNVSREKNCIAHSCI